MGQNPGPCRGSAGRPRLHVEGGEGCGLVEEGGGAWCSGGRRGGCDGVGGDLKHCIEDKCGAETFTRMTVPSFPVHKGKYCSNAVHIDMVD